MAPGAHLLISWLATVEVFKERRERALVTLSGVAPDLDGIGLVVDLITGTTSYYVKYHHYLGHSIISAFLLATLVTCLAKSQKALVWLACLFVVHLHMLCDLVGSRGADGYQWPIYYFYPLNSNGVTWHGQWELNAWQNQLIMLLLFTLCTYYLVTRKITFLEVFNKNLDKAAIGLYESYLLKKK